MVRSWSAIETTPTPRVAPWMRYTATDMIGKNSANAGSSSVPRPKPENSVRPEASRATVATTT